MTILTSGEVGIGTVTPTHRLHILTPNLTADGILMENTNGSTGEASISFRNAGANGTGIKLWTVGLNENRNLAFNYGTNFNGPNSHMLIDSTGNVGIGNITPTEALDVTGNIKSSGNLSATGNVNVSGEINRTATGATNMVPICYASVSLAGGINSGSGNLSVSHPSTGLYTITITGETYTSTGYATLVTPLGASFRVTVSTDLGGDLQIRIFDLTGALINNAFHFTVFKP
jgi:hypothetical protein